MKISKMTVLTIIIVLIFVDRVFVSEFGLYNQDIKFIRLCIKFNIFMIIILGIISEISRRRIIKFKEEPQKYANMLKSLKPRKYKLIEIDPKDIYFELKDAYDKEKAFDKNKITFIDLINDNEIYIISPGHRSILDWSPENPFATLMIVSDNIIYIYQKCIHRFGLVKTKGYSKFNIEIIKYIKSVLVNDDCKN